MKSAFPCEVVSSSVSGRLSAWIKAACLAFMLPTVTDGAGLLDLSDEFSDASTLSEWQRIYEFEQTGADQLESIDIGASREGWLTLMPYSSTWYNDWRGVLVFKNVTGDFVMSTRVHTTNRAGNGPPNRVYSLGGIMIRTPRDPETVSELGHQNYIFLSHGAATPAGQYSFEVKTTVNSNSTLQVTPTSANTVEIQVARLGAAFILLRREEGGEWQVHRRYNRTDMPATMQAGLTVYTDWSHASQTPPAQHNVTTITDGNPDLIAEFDYVRYRSPSVPTALQSANFMDEGEVTDEELLSFLGDNANSALEPGDPDADGVDTMLEVFFGTDPYVPDREAMNLELNYTDGSWTLGYPRARNTHGVEATLEWSEDLSLWESSGWGTPVVVDDSTDPERLEVSIAAEDDDPLFMRFSLAE